MFPEWKPEYSLGQVILLFVLLGMYFNVVWWLARIYALLKKNTEFTNLAAGHAHLNGIAVEEVKTQLVAAVAVTSAKIDDKVDGAVTQITTVASDVAATLASQTPPAGTPLPAELRVVIAAESDRPHLVTG